MPDALFTGVGVALVTLFDDHGGLDEKATADFAARLVDLGVRGVVVAGSTGEAATLDPDERVRLLFAVRAAVPPSIPVLAGTGAPSARQAVALTVDARDNGADGVLVLSPPRTGDVGPYYAAVVDAAGAMPVLGYHFPAVSQPGIAVNALAALPIAALKDSSGDADRLLEEVTTWDRPLYTGSAALLAYAGPIGCRGAILSLANLDPETCAAAFTGDADAQRRLAPAQRGSRVPFPGALKQLLAERFGTSTVTRSG